MAVPADAWLNANRARLSGGYRSKNAISPRQSKVMRLSWRDFLAAVREPGDGYFRDRIELLADAREAFRSHPDYASMDKDTRAMVAGIPNGRTENQGYFGSVRGDGVLHAVIKKDPADISAALDRIPREGPVVRKHYDAFVRAFEAAMPDGRKRPGIAGRLLALKHPNTFVCLSSANRAALAANFGMPVSSIDFDPYWSSVIVRIMDSRWWSTLAPRSGDELAVSQGRAAMLDAIFYDDGGG